MIISERDGMSRTRGHNKHNEKGLRNKELWSRRPGAQMMPAKKAYRKLTARVERQNEREELHKEMREAQL